MPTLRLLRSLLIALLVLLPALAQPAPEVPAASQPFPTLDPGMHTAPIFRFAVDRAGHYGVSASHDKTARVWDLHDGRLLQTLRVPVGTGHEGKLFAVAISPDGATVAVGGWTSPGIAGQESVFFFDRASGRLQGRISGLPNVVTHLAWSPDGQRLAIALGEGGIRVHGATPPFAELRRDADYGGASYSVDFDTGGRLVSTALDGKLRLYDRQLKRVGAPQTLEGGSRPFFARFSPDGRRIAVGFDDSTAVQIVSATDLRPLTRLDTGAADNGHLGSVAWSADGRRVLAAGRNQVNGQLPIRVFDPDSGRQLAAWPVSTDAVMDLQPLADGRVLFASGDPSWGVVDPQGRVGRQQRPPQEDHRDNFDGFRMSADGARVAFEHKTWRDGAWQRSSRVFDWRSLRLETAAAPPAMTPPRRDGLVIEDWKDTTRPHLAGQPLPLEPYEASRSLAVAADGRHFALGTEWSVRWFDAAGKPQWETSVPVAWLVNLSADGHFMVAALGDGTLRWYRTQDGSEALALFVHADGERWVAWTPEGFFAASSPEAEQLFGYTLNQGRDKEAEFVSSAQLREQFFRPALLTARLDGNEAAIAAAVKEVGEVRELLARGLPPELGELQVTDLGNGEYRLQASITPRSGGVGRASVRVNGAEKQAEPSREVPVNGFFSQRLPLPPGRVKLEVSIYAAGDRLLSKTRSVELQVPERRVVALRKPRLHVVAVGVSHYYDPSLRDGVSFAADDARSLADTLGQYHDRRLMELAEPHVLTEQNATRDAIVAALQAVARDAKLEDVVVLYLAGHGTQDDAGDYQYQPYEARYNSRAALLAQSVSGTQLRRLLEGIQASKLVVLLDTCSSSKFYLARRDAASNEAVARFATLSGRAVVSASAREAREHASLRHGLFTDAVLRGLGGAAADATGDVMVSGLADYVEGDVEKNALRLFGNAQITQREFAPEFRNFALTRKR